MIVTNNRRLIGFDIARMCSIIWIIAIYHVLPSAGFSLIAPIKTVTYSSLGIFTFISSFLLASRYSFNEKDEIRLFYKKRFLRFYPLFFISSVILLLIGYNTTSSTLKGLIGISPFWKPHPTTMWYCSMLISLYLLTPFWAKGGLKKQQLKFVVTMMIIGVIECLFHSVEPRTFCYYPVYFLGLIIAQYKYESFVSRMSDSHMIVKAVIPFFLILLFEFYYRSQWLIILNSGLGIIALMSLYMTIGEMLRKKKMSRTEGVIRILSYSSMCMYLFHREIHALLLYLYKPSKSLGMLFYLGVVGLITTVIISFIIQSLYDKSLNNKVL